MASEYLDAWLLVGITVNGCGVSAIWSPKPELTHALENQVLELAATDHPCFIAAQFHPELTSRPLRPQPLFMGLVAAAIARKHPDAAREPAIARWLHAPAAVATA